MNVDVGLMWSDEVVRHHAATLYPAAFRLARNRTDAEDLVQETFAKAIAASPRLRQDSNLSAWLHRIMINTFISGYRKRRREPLLAGADLAEGEAGLAQSRDPAAERSAEDQILRCIIAPDIVAAMRALPARRRVAVYLADVEGLGYQQISELTGIPVGTVKSCLYRGRGQLRAELAMHEPRPTAPHTAAQPASGAGIAA